MNNLIPSPQHSQWSEYDQMSAQLLTPESRFLAAALAGHNVFLTGIAGTGKTWQLMKFIEECPRRVDVTAPTGVAALNARGSTLYRFCGMMLGPQGLQTNEEYFKQLIQDPRPSIQAGFNRVQRCEVLVVDEISMLPGRQLEFVEFLFRRLRGSENPFGGCQIIVVGDFLQLPPVRKIESVPYDWAFQTPAWEAGRFKAVVLEQVRRQDERAFVNALGDFRLGRVYGESARLLQSRVRMNPPSSMQRLLTHNDQVNKWNDIQLSDLPGEATQFDAVQTGPDNQRAFLTKNLLTPAKLLLKPGALVMFTVNRSESGCTRPLFVNGQLGKVEGIRPGLVVVRTTGGETISVEPFTWLYDDQDESSASSTQFPLRLAYAMTIHKAQGLTLESAFIDIRAAREPGQAYVAVSRVRTLAGLNFKGWLKGVHVSPEAIKFYEGIR